MNTPVAYNFKEFKKFDNLPVVSRSALRRGQAALYDILVDRVNTGMPITFEEAKDIWLTKVCRKMYNGKPHRTIYGYWDDNGDWQEHFKDIPMTEMEISFAVLDWLTRNIGLLVMRGYLKVIPMIQLEPIHPKTAFIGKETP